MLGQDEDTVVYCIIIVRCGVNRPFERTLHRPTNISPPSGNRLARPPLLHSHREGLVFVVVVDNIVATTAVDSSLLPTALAIVRLARRFGYVPPIMPLLFLMERVPDWARCSRMSMAKRAVSTRCYALSGRAEARPPGGRYLWVHRYVSSCSQTRAEGRRRDAGAP